VGNGERLTLGGSCRLECSWLSLGVDIFPELRYDLLTHTVVFSTMVVVLGVSMLKLTSREEGGRWLAAAGVVLPVLAVLPPLLAWLSIPPEAGDAIVLRLPEGDIPLHYFAILSILLLAPLAGLFYMALVPRLYQKRPFVAVLLNCAVVVAPLIYAVVGDGVVYSRRDGGEIPALLFIFSLASAVCAGGLTVCWATGGACRSMAIECGRKGSWRAWLVLFLPLLAPVAALLLFTNSR
jgi:hypothetical protein